MTSHKTNQLVAFIWIVAVIRLTLPQTAHSFVLRPAEDASKAAAKQDWIVVVGQNRTRADDVAAKMITALLQNLGGRVEEKRSRSAEALTSNVFLVGTAASNPSIRQLRQDEKVASKADLGDEGFHLRTTERSRRYLVALEGGGPLGVVYGADELKSRIRKWTDFENLDLRDRPHFKLRGYKMVLPLSDDFIARRRINTVYLPTWLPVGTDFAGVYAGLKVMEEMAEVGKDQWPALQWHEQRNLTGLFDHLSQPSAEIERQIDLYRQRIRELSAIGVKVFISRYEWGFPILTLARRYFPGEVITGDSQVSEKGIQLCLSSERMQRMIRLTYQRTFELFPELAGVVVYTSAEGGFGNPCDCEKCRTAFETFQQDVPAGFRVGGPRAERGSPEVQFFHKWAFDLIYQAIRAVRPDAVIVRNTWDFQPIKTPLAADFVHRYTPEDVIFMPYTVSTDTNLREGPNPQIAQWTRWGRPVVPKMAQLMELHPRSNCFPNDITERLKHFYRSWADAGVYGVTLHGGWFPGENFGAYEAMERNIGFGLNIAAHWKLLWNPYRNDLEDLSEAWVKEVFGKQSGDVARRCLGRAGEIYLLGPTINVADRPTYRDYINYAAKADGVSGRLYPFGFDMILLADKIHHKFFAEPSFLHSEFVYNYEEYVPFQDNLNRAYKLLDENVSALKAALKADSTNKPLAALLEWFQVEREYLEGVDLLYDAEEKYLIAGEWDAAAIAFGQANDRLRSSLQRWGRIALEQNIWPFSVGGHFYPYNNPPLDVEGRWLDEGVFGVFFRWLSARRDDPRGPDRIGSYETGAWHFHNGLKKFHWPMQ